MNSPTPQPTQLLNNHIKPRIPSWVNWVILSIVVLLVSGVVWWLENTSWLNPVEKEESIITESQIFITQEECEKTTNKKCTVQLCDYKCPRDFKKGWVPTNEGIAIKTQKQLALESIKNMEYPFTLESSTKFIRLKNGFYKEESDERFFDIAEIRILELFSVNDLAVSFGELNNDGLEEAVMILTSYYGGTGNFRELAVVVNDNNIPHYLTSIPLGDRILINSIIIQDKIIILNTVIHSPNDGLCCPTVNKISKYKLLGNKLIELEEVN